MTEQKQPDNKEESPIVKAGLSDEFNTNPKGDEMCLAISKYYAGCKTCIRSMECLNFCKLEKIHYELQKLNQNIK